MSDRGRRGFLKQVGATTLATAAGTLRPWSTGGAAATAGALPVATAPEAAPTACPPVAGQVATVWLGYALCVPAGEGEAYRPPRRIGGADKLPAVFHVS
jgi:hypothetical protein